MNVLRRMEELRVFAAEALKQARTIGGETESIIVQQAYNVSVLISKIQTWKESGAKTFFLSKDLVEAFQHTDVPMESSPTDFQYPFETFMLESETPLFLTPTPDGAREVYAILYLSDKAVYADPNVTLITSNGVSASELEWNKSLTGLFPGSYTGLENIMIHMKDSLSIKDAVNHVKEGAGILPLGQSDAQNLINIFYNSIMYINDPERDRAETEVACSRKIKVSGDKREKSSYILLKPPKNYVSLSKSGGGTLDKRFVVRGHWRMQSYGEKHSLRRRTWIKPFWKGPELAEIINKPYKVE